VRLGQRGQALGHAHAGGRYGVSTDSRTCGDCLSFEAQASITGGGSEAPRAPALAEAA